MDADALRVLTYNVRRDVPADGTYDWAGRREAVASTIRFHCPDVVGLQEPLAHQYRDLREALPAFAWVGQSRNEGEGKGEFCPVAYRTDRFEREAAGTFWLSETPDVPGSVGWDATHPRVATWVRLRDERRDASLVYLNTHFDHEGERARRESAGRVLDRLARIRTGDAGSGDAERAVVGGDFNCTPAGEAYAVLAGATDRESPLRDARLASPHPPHGPTTTKVDFESLVPDRRIDHVFVDGFDVAGYAVATDMGGDGWFPSDHFPVVVDLSV